VPTEVHLLGSHLHIININANYGNCLTLRLTIPARKSKTASWLMQPQNETWSMFLKWSLNNKKCVNVCLCNQPYVFIAWCLSIFLFLLSCLTVLLVWRLCTVDDGMISEYGMGGGMRLWKQNSIIYKKLTAVPNCLPVSSHELTWAETRVAVVGSL
jgi:hypothetical protein